MIPSPDFFDAMRRKTRSHHLYLARRTNLLLADIQVVGRRVSRTRKRPNERRALVKQVMG